MSECTRNPHPKKISFLIFLTCGAALIGQQQQFKREKDAHPWVKCLVWLATVLNQAVSILVPCQRSFHHVPMWPSEAFYQISISELFEDLSVDRALETSCRPSLGSTQTASRHTLVSDFLWEACLCFDWCVLLKATCIASSRPRYTILVSALNWNILGHHNKLS